MWSNSDTVKKGCQHFYSSQCALGAISYLSNAFYFLLYFIDLKMKETRDNPNVWHVNYPIILFF